MLPLRAPVHAMSSYGLGHFCSDPTDVNQLRWVPDEGEAVSELVSLWPQPGSEKPFVLSLALLAGKKDSRVCGVISALRPDVVTDSWCSLKESLSQSDEAKIVGSVSNLTKRKGWTQFSNLESKYHCLEAVLGCVSYVTSKSLLCEWGSGLLHKKKSLRVMWSVWCPTFFDAADLISDAEDDLRGVDAGALSSNATPIEKSSSAQVRLLLETHGNLSLEEKDHLQSLLASSYRDSLAVDLLLLPAAGIVEALAHASQDELAWLTGTLVAFTKWVRVDRQQVAQLQCDKQGKDSLKRLRETSASPNAKAHKQARLGSNPSLARVLDVDEAERTTGSGMPDNKTVESNPRPIGIRNDAGRREDQSGQPQLKWTAGAGRGAVTVEKYAKSADRLKPILLQGLERVDALDAFAAVQKVFGMISLDYRTFRDMLNQYGEIVMYVPAPQLALLTDGEKTGNLRVSSARALHGYSDQVEVRELTISDAMKRVGTHIPIPPPTKMESTPYRSTGILMSGQRPRVALCAAPPFCPGNAFVSLWGPGLQCEFGGAVLLPLEVPEIDAEFCEIFAKHSIWSLVLVFGSGASTQGTAEPESDAQWESARQQVDIFVKQSCGLASDAPLWVRISIAKSKCVSRARKNRAV